MSDNNKTQLGKILLKQKLVKPDELESMLAEQRTDHERLASKTLDKGYADEIGLLKALSEQHGVPATNLDEVEIDLKSLDVIPQDIALKHLILPVTISGDSIHLAMANPDDRRVIEEIEFVSGKRVFPHVALHNQLMTAIDACYTTRSTGQTTYKGKNHGKTPSRFPSAPPGHPISEEPAVIGSVIADQPENFDDMDMGIEIEMEPEDISIVAQMPSSNMAREPQPLPTATPPGPDPMSSQPAPAQPIPPSPPSQPTSQPTVDGGANGHMKVLVVDDEDDIRLLIARVLSDKGYSVVTAARGLEAIQKVQSESPDMIILDAMLPEVHGFDICKKIKNSSKYGHIPVIMISAIYRGWRYAQDLKISYGVDDFIEKPFKINEILEKVDALSRTSTPDTRSQAEALSQEAERSLQAGIDAYRAGHIDAAIDMLKRGIGIDPLAFKLHYHLALLLGKKGLGYQAIRALENALELAPHYFPALKNLAVLYQKAGFKFKAIETWERALGYCPDDETRDGIKRHLVSLL